MNAEEDQFRSLFKSSPALGKSFFCKPAPLVAKNLIGKTLISQVDGLMVAGTIVESEAYLAQGDSACHGATKRTPKNEVMFGDAGIAYVYAIHARWCFNVVTAPEGQSAAVLIRAVQPIVGIETMRDRRGITEQRDLCRGPARLCEAFAIDKTQNGKKLAESEAVWIVEQVGSGVAANELLETVRIGVTSAKQLKLRYVLCESVYASGPKYLNQKKN